MQRRMMWRGGESGRQLRCCDRWRESFDKEQRGGVCVYVWGGEVAEVSKIMAGGGTRKKRKKLSPLTGEKQLGGSMIGN